MDIYYSFDRPGERKVVERLILEIVEDVAGAKKHKAFVQPVHRLGGSGAAVYEVDIDELYFRVIKIDTRSDIEQETNGASKIAQLIGEDAAVTVPRGAQRGRLAGLIYNHAGGPRREEAKRALELESVIRKRPLADSRKAVTKLFRWWRDRAYEKQPLHINRAEDICEWYSDPDFDYLRTTRARYVTESAGERVSAVLEGYSPRNHAGMLDPNYVLDALRHIHVDLTMGPVHGDLHPRNVMFDPELRRPHLIDFKWSRSNSHVMLDYVLMEVTLRFLDVPRCCNMHNEAAVNIALLNERGKLDPPKCRYLPHRRRYERISELIPIIRRSAKKASKTDSWYTEYLCSLFLVLYGLLIKPQYDARIAVNALGVIGKRLAKLGLIQQP